MIEHRDLADPPEAPSPEPIEAPQFSRPLPAHAEPKTPRPGRRRRWRGFLWLALFGVLGYIGFRYYQAAQQKQQAAQAAQAARLAHRAVPVAAAAARRGDIPIYLRGLGTVTAFNTVNVKPRVDGPLVAVNYKEGQFVTKGQVLAEIDPRTFQVAVEQAEGQLARDQAQQHDAEVNLARFQKLWDEQVIARQQLDTQAAQVGQFKGAIATDQANIDNARLNLSFTKIQAPLSGRIGLRLVDVGNMVHAGDPNPLAIITQMQPIAVLFTLPAGELPPVLAKLRAGAKLPVDAYDSADRNRIAAGSLLTVDNQIDTNTGTTRLKAIFDNQNNALFPNQFVNCRLLLDTRRGVTIVPAPAVERGPQGTYVYVVAADGTAAMRTITEGITEGSDVEVTGGLTPGETVVTDGQDKLQQGSKVEVRAANGAAGSAGGRQPR
ncbi:MAG: MdtA/MuxA family multidrug efflux RND transporter periplasmic adaptor subunit [Acidobacteriia bacterium]|nr:MdtA/MuxA family multidrug efflux RND transporter periplasmic adaptor subunit [Terriglobia bacterium]